MVRVAIYMRDEEILPMRTTISFRAVAPVTRFFPPILIK